MLVADSGFDQGDTRALRILGASAQGLHRATATSERARPAAVAVAADLFTADGCVRERVLHAYDRDLAEVTVWGAQIPAELSARFTSVEHVLSAAAKVFKAHALCAAATSAMTVSATEAFCRGALRGSSGGLRPVGQVAAGGYTVIDKL